jgi:hypothetical protein
MSGRRLCQPQTAAAKSRRLVVLSSCRLSERSPTLLGSEFSGGVCIILVPDAQHSAAQRWQPGHKHQNDYQNSGAAGQRDASDGLKKGSVAMERPRSSAR